jgi:hypothetical protein
MKVYCPRCGQEQISHEVRFCSRCGFLMNGLAEVVLNGGMLQQTEAKPPTPRRRGLRQGGGLILLGALVVPLLGVLTNLLYFSTYFVGLAAIIFFLGGILRMVYALVFESGNPNEKTLEENVYQAAQKLLKKQQQPNALPPPQSIPADAYAPPTQGTWRDTNDLMPTSVTDNTTKLLSKEDGK